MTTFDPPRPWTASYADGVPIDLDPVSGCLTDIVEQSAADYPDAPALQFFGRVTTYAQLQDQILRAAAALRTWGLLPVTPWRSSFRTVRSTLWRSTPR